MSTGTLHRIKNEVKILSIQNKSKHFKLEIIDESHYNWKVIINGPENSLYAGYAFELVMALPVDYPFSSPKIKFITKILHLNVNSDGDICLDLLKDQWKSSYGIQTVIMAILQLLSEPNSNDPLNSELAAEYRDNKTKYNEKIKNHCEKYGLKLISD